MTPPRKLLAALLLLLAATSLQAAKRRAITPPSEENLSAEDWLRAHAIPFATVEPGSGIADLRILDHIVADARIVSLGEATHASHQFFAMKHRMVEYLVQEKGFTVFSMEAGLADADRLNDYVIDGKGDPSALLAAMGYWVWNTDEVLGLIQWMRDYNLSRGSKPAVSFRGFDAQGTKVAAQVLTDYLKSVDPSNADFLMGLYNCYKPYDLAGYTYKGLPTATKDQCRDQLSLLHDTIAAHRDDYVAKSSTATFERMLRYARTLQQAEEMNSFRRGDVVDGRDEMMAENVDWIANIEHPAEKVIVWAHNAHVAAQDDYLMGHILREQYFPGDQMVIFGFSFDRGSFHAFKFPLVGQRLVFDVTSPGDGQEAFFRTAGRPLMFVDLRHAGSRAARDAFDVQTKRMWEIGAIYDPANPNDYRPDLIVAKNYDVVIWIESVTPTHLR